MGRLCSLAVALFVFGACAAYAEEPVSIPLKDIWGFKMPGTRDMRTLDGVDLTKTPDSLADRVIRSQLANSGKAKPAGFAVSGSGLEALRRAYAIVHEQQARPKQLPSTESVSLFFTSMMWDQYIHIQSVERINHTITIRYRFVPHMTRELTAHMALIPLGRLPEGRWHVLVSQLPMDKKSLDGGYTETSAEFARKIVCSSFDFDVSGVVRKAGTK